MTIRIFSQEIEAEEFTVVGIGTTVLVTIRDIVKMLLDVKEEMRLRWFALDRQERMHGGRTRKPGAGAGPLLLTGPALMVRASTASWMRTLRAC